MWSPLRQALYWVDILGRRLFRYRPDTGARQSWLLPEPPSAVAERTSGRLVLALASGLADFDPDSGALTRRHVIEPDRPANRLNDAKCDAAGRLWVGSMHRAGKQPTGSLYRYEEAGEGADLKAYESAGQCTRMESGYTVVNGPAFSRDGQRMFHTDTPTGTVYVSAFDAQTGALGVRHVFVRFDTGAGYPDGMCVDGDDHLWIALFGGAAVLRVDPSGRVVTRIALPCSNVSSCTFGDADLGTLYITTAHDGLDAVQRARQPLAGGLFAIRLPGIRGLPAARFGS